MIGSGTVGLRPLFILLIIFLPVLLSQVARLSLSLNPKSVVPKLLFLVQIVSNCIMVGPVILMKFRVQSQIILLRLMKIKKLLILTVRPILMLMLNLWRGVRPRPILLKNRVLLLFTFSVLGVIPLKLRGRPTFHSLLIIIARLFLQTGRMVMMRRPFWSLLLMKFVSVPSRVPLKPSFIHVRFFSLISKPSYIFWLAFWGRFSL